MASRVVLQVKGAPTPGVNPFAKKKAGSKKPAAGRNPAIDDPEDQIDGGADEDTEDPASQAEVPAHEPDKLEQQADPAGLAPDPEADPNTDPNTDPNADPTKTPKGGQGQPEDQADTVHPHEWAGDVYDEGDETDPDQSFAAFTGQGGEEAWLDRADDGTITGWVRDADGTVYRYSDDNAWATDVDDAGMQQTHGPQPGQAGQDDPMQQQGQQPDPAAAGQQPPPGEQSLFDQVTKKDHPGGGLVVVDQGRIAAELAALGKPHLQAWAR